MSETKSKREWKITGKNITGEIKQWPLAVFKIKEIVMQEFIELDF